MIQRALGAHYAFCYLLVLLPIELWHNPEVRELPQIFESRCEAHDEMFVFLALVSTNFGEKRKSCVNSLLSTCMDTCRLVGEAEEHLFYVLSYSSEILVEKRSFEFK